MIGSFHFGAISKMMPTMIRVCTSAWQLDEPVAELGGESHLCPQPPERLGCLLSPHRPVHTAIGRVTDGIVMQTANKVLGFVVLMQEICSELKAAFLVNRIE